MMPIRTSLAAREESDGGGIPFTVARRFSSPDELLVLERGRVGALAVGGAILGHAVFDPGWHWTSVRGRARDTQSVVGYVLAGRLGLRTASDRAFDVIAGDVFCTTLARGLDTRVIGYRPAEVLYIQGTEALVRGLRG